MQAIITGASQGIGKAIAMKLAQEGLNLFLISRNIEKLNHLKSELDKLYPEQTFKAYSTDVTDIKSVKSTMLEILDEKQSIDILVNNAGTFIPGSIHNEEEGNMELMMETNLYSAYHVSRAVLPQLIEQKSGHIFNMCSIASQVAYENGGSYSISKFALLGFSKCLREEMKPHGVKVTQLMPGATKTPSWDGVDLPDERFMKPEDIADILWATFTLSKNTTVEDIVLRPQLGDI